MSELNDFQVTNKYIDSVTTDYTRQIKTRQAS